MLTVNVLQTDSNTNLIGPFDDNYKKTDTFSIDSTVWSPCGYDGMLNINSEVRIAPLISPNPALMTVSFSSLSSLFCAWESSKVADILNSSIRPT